MGNDPIDRNTFGNPGYTFIDLLVPAPKGGILTSASFYMNQVNSASWNYSRVKVFRDDGTYYRYIGQGGDLDSLVAGLNTIPLSILIQAGDFISFYCSFNGDYPAGDRIDLSLTGGSCATRGSDITTDVLKTSWATEAYTLSLQGSVLTKGMIIE